MVEEIHTAAPDITAAPKKDVSFFAAHNERE